MAESDTGRGEQIEAYPGQLTAVSALALLLPGQGLGDVARAPQSRVGKGPPDWVGVDGSTHVDVTAAADKMLYRFAGGAWSLVTGGGSGATVLWAPGQTGALQTWAEVKDALDASLVGLLIQLSGAGPFTIPGALGVQDLKDSVFFRVEISGIGSAVVDVGDGTVLHRLYGCRNGATVVVHPTAAPALTFDPFGGAPAILQTILNGDIVNAGSFPAIVVADAGLMVIVMLDSGAYSAGTAALVRLGVGAVCFVGASGGCIIGNDIIESVDSSAVLVFRSDGTGPYPFPSQAGFTGTYYNAATGPAGYAETAADLPSSIIGILSAGTMALRNDLKRPVFLDKDQATWLDPMAPAVPSYNQTTPTFGVPEGPVGKRGRTVFGSVLLANTGIGKATIHAQVETAIGSGIYVDVQKYEVQAGILWAGSMPFTFYVGPSLGYQFVNGAAPGVSEGFDFYSWSE